MIVTSNGIIVICIARTKIHSLANNLDLFCLKLNSYFTCFSSSILSYYIHDHYTHRNQKAQLRYCLRWITIAVTFGGV